MAIKRAIKAGDKSIISFKKAIKVGEITQLVAKDKFPATKTEQGVTFTNNGDGSVTANGTTTNQYYSEININIGDTYQWQEDDHKYLLLSGLSSNAGSKIECILWVGRPDGAPGDAYNAADLNSSFGVNFTIPKGQYIVKQIKCRIRSGYTAENVTFTPQLFDLTEMFGAGHEPATVAEFRAKFPETYYPYQRAVLTVYNKVVRPCARKGEVVQLVNPTTIAPNATIANMPLTYNGEGTFYLSGTASAAGGGRTGWGIFIGMIKGHKYLTESFYDKMLLIFTDKTNNRNYQGVDRATPIFEFIKENGQYIMGWNVNPGETYDVTITPQLFDLTAMYGAGNEPKTLADFRKDFPESYYPYSPIQTKNLLKMVINNAQYHVTSTISGDVWTIIPRNSGGYGQLKAHLPAGTYTLSGVICNNNEFSTKINYTILSEAPNAGNIFALGYLQNNLTFTLDKEKDFYILLYPAFGIDNSLGVYRKAWYKLQIEKGSVATDYVPHDYI